MISCGRATTTATRALRPSRRSGKPGLSLYRTDEDGRVVLESDGDRITVRKGSLSRVGGQWPPHRI